MSIVTEDTCPAEADSGIRRFVIQREDRQIIVQVRQEAQETCDGEIHPVHGFGPVHQVVTNADLVQALIQLSSEALKATRHQSLLP